MLNNKGQALVEFIIIVPILIFIIMAIIDFGNITIRKMRLENNLDTVISLYKKQDFEEIQNLTTSEKFDFSYDSNQDTTTITLNQNIKILTPFLNIILGNDYLLETRRVIYNE